MDPVEPSRVMDFNKLNNNTANQSTFHVGLGLSDRRQLQLV